MAMPGDLRSQGWQYERYPGVYPDKKGSGPLPLLVLNALLPSYAGNHDHALARLYALLASEDAAALKAAGGGAAGSLGASPSARRSSSLSSTSYAPWRYPNAVAHLEQLVAAVQARRRRRRPWRPRRPRRRATPSPRRRSRTSSPSRPPPAPAR